MSLKFLNKATKTFILSFLISFSITLNSYSQEKNIYNEAVSILQEYLKIDTTNPPGNEMETAKFLKNILDKEGIENKILDLGDNRANFYARLKGDGSKKPLIIMHHMDVVPAEKEFWKYEPFSGKIENGFIYGRGAIDIKGKGIVDLMTMINLKRNNFPLKRDLIFLGVSDEEVGSIGAKWMIDKGAYLIKDAEYLLDEGELVIADENNKIKYYSVSIGEKSPLWLNLTFSGTPGHGSVPIKDSSVNRAVRAANKIINHEFKFNVIPGIEEMLKMYVDNPENINGYTKNFETSLKNKTFLKEISKNDEVNALIRNTVSVTGLKGSDKINTIPNQASIQLDCRLIPGVEKDKFINELKEIINDDSVNVEVVEYYESKYSNSNTELVNILRDYVKKTYPYSKVVPTVLTSSTDASVFRSIGINVYGFESYYATDEELSRAHGNDERIAIDSIKFGINMLTHIIKELNK